MSANGHLVEEEGPSNTVVRLWGWMRRAEDDALVYVTLGDRAYALDLDTCISRVRDTVNEDGSPGEPEIDMLVLNLHPEPVPMEVMER
jgi:hypothetical protein